MAALWMVAALALVTAVSAVAYARGLALKLAHLTEMYWQLKYDHGELKAKVNPPQPAAAQPQQTFVPLSSIKKS
jgi:hypothetical protein